MNIRFFYKNNQKSIDKEVVITSFTNAVSKVIDLPDTIEICLYPLGPSVYGGIDLNNINRIGINIDLPIASIPKILAHELIHVHQKHTGILKMKPNGEIYWHGVFYTRKNPEDMTYEEYQNLPWERDVAEKQHKVFRDALALTNNPNSCIL